jgi:hypothetical protein
MTLGGVCGAAEGKRREADEHENELCAFHGHSLDRDPKKDLSNF